MERISARTRFGGLIGSGISYSLSPLIHNVSAEILGLDCVYLAFDMAEAPSAAFFDTMLKANCFGFNVTVPYKEAVARSLTEGRLRTCNTLVPRSTRWEVASTDAEGFLKGLAEGGISLETMECFIFLGYGGAAKALLGALRAKHPHVPVKVLRRAATDPLPDGVDGLDFSVVASQESLRVRSHSLLIQASSAPSEALAPFVPALKSLKGAFVDLVYGRSSPLLEAARLLSLPSQDGLPMLIHQALLAQELWWGQSAPAHEVRKRLVQLGRISPWTSSG